MVELIQNSEDRDAARAGLQESFEFSEEQAAHIVRMQLGSLTSMEATDIEEEYEDVQNTIDYLESVLNSREKLDSVIADELQEVKDEYGDDRRTSIIEDEGQVTHEDLIPEEDCVVVITEDDYIKRMPVENFDPQNRGGKGIIGPTPRRTTASRRCSGPTATTTCSVSPTRGRSTGSRPTRSRRCPEPLGASPLSTSST